MATEAGKKRLQMADIARLAGVSVSTVSRALAGNLAINAETRGRIVELARSLNYSINIGAQNLRLQKNQTIAVVVPYDAKVRQHISDPFFLSLVGALADALTDRGYDMLLSRVDADSLDSAAALVEGGKAIGLVVVGQWRHHDQLNALAARRLPLVVWGGQLARQLYCSVGGDNVMGGLLATRHLLGLGRRRVLFAGDARLPEVDLRREGWRQALREAGIEPDPALELMVPFEAIGARARFDERMALGVDFDGLAACSDLMAVQAVQALRAAGHTVPGDVAVVGYDDMPIATYTEPPLTSVHQPVLLAGEELVEALLAQLRGEAVAPRTLPVHLVARASAPAVAAA